MRLTKNEALARLAAYDHGALCMVHAERGVDAVPVVYAVDDDGCGYEPNCAGSKTGARERQHSPAN